MDLISIKSLRKAEHWILKSFFLRKRVALKAKLLKENYDLARQCTVCLPRRLKLLATGVLKIMQAAKDTFQIRPPMPPSWHATYNVFYCSR